MKVLLGWLKQKWVQQDHQELCTNYYVTFSSPSGQSVLRHLLDTVYFNVYEGSDPHEAAIHNAKRCVIHDILVNIDAGENPNKYKLKTEEDHGLHP